MSGRVRPQKTHETWLARELLSKWKSTIYLMVITTHTIRIRTKMRIILRAVRTIRQTQEQCRGVLVYYIELKHKNMSSMKRGRQAVLPDV